jgi:N-acyl-D-aspartate/D-glutamate deacylase
MRRGKDRHRRPVGLWTGLCGWHAEAAEDIATAGQPDLLIRNGMIYDGRGGEMLKTQGDIHYDITWNTLGEFLDQLVARGISPNVASFVGAATVRAHELGSPAGVRRMRRTPVLGR